MQISNEGLSLIKAHEGYREKMYFDQAGLPTIGYGTLIDTVQEKKYLTEPITRTEAEDLLRRDVSIAEKAVENYVRVPLEQYEFDALTSFVYNIGQGNFRNSTLLTLLNSGSNKEDVADQFMRWIYAGGRVSSGLEKRREKEKSLFLGFTWKKKV